MYSSGLHRGGCVPHAQREGGSGNERLDAGRLQPWLETGLRASRPSDDSLLETYSSERQPVAKELIDFDREWASIMSAPPRDPSDPDSTGSDPAELGSYFERSGRYTAGVATRYQPALLTRSPVDQALAGGLPVGIRFHSARVRRLTDAKPMHLGHAASADGRWRLYAFGDDRPIDHPASRLRAFCEYLEEESRIAPAAVHPGRRAVRWCLRPPGRAAATRRRGVRCRPADGAHSRKGRFSLVDREKVYCAEPFDGEDIFDARSISREAGALVVVRPDQYVAAVLALDDHCGLEEEFFAAFMCDGPDERKQS